VKFRNPFTVKPGQKISEKQLFQTLICAACGILLCMGCLAGTTWALFSATLVNEDNVIQIARPEIKVEIIGDDHAAVPEQNGTYTLAAGKKYTVTVTLKEDSGTACDVYAILWDEEQTSAKYVKLTKDAKVMTFELQLLQETTLSFSVSWSAPVPGTELQSNAPTETTAPIESQTP